MYLSKKELINDDYLIMIQCNLKARGSNQSMKIFIQSVIDSWSNKLTIPTYSWRFKTCVASLRRFWSFSGGWSWSIAIHTSCVDSWSVSSNFRVIVIQRDAREKVRNRLERGYLWMPYCVSLWGYSGGILCTLEVFINKVCSLSPWM